jgi:hypothetical protein
MGPWVNGDAGALGQRVCHQRSSHPARGRRGWKNALSGDLSANRPAQAQARHSEHFPTRVGLQHRGEWAGTGGGFHELLQKSGAFGRSMMRIRTRAGWPQ